MPNDRGRSTKNNAGAVFNRPPTRDADTNFCAAQPKLAAELAKKVNSRIVKQLEDVPFDVEACTHADNLECGLAIEFEHIMGFFMEMSKAGCDLDEKYITEETLLHMAHWAHELVDLNLSLKEPCRPDTTSTCAGTHAEKCHCIPSKVVVLLSFKAKTTMCDNSFFRAFYRAFHRLVTAGNNKERHECAMNEVKALCTAAPGLSHSLLINDNVDAYSASSCNEDQDSNMVDAQTHCVEHSCDHPMGSIETSSMC